MSNQHALYSPSSAHRWLRCFASLKLEAQEPRKDSAYSREGTAAHSLAAMALEQRKPAIDFAEEKLTCPSTGIAFTKSMAEDVQVYVDMVEEYARDNLLLIEQRVDFSEIIDYPKSFGTADAIILTRDGTEIQCHDLKFGMGVAVYAEENEQLMLYALGTYHLLSTIEDVSKVETIRLVIHQPRQQRLSEWTCSLDDLLFFGKRCKAAVKLTQEANPSFNPGEKQCEFCKVKGKCKALANHVLRSIGDEFDNLDNGEQLLNLENTLQNAKERVVTLTADQLGSLYFNLDIIHDWIKAVRAAAEAKLFAGEEVPGLKLVEGKLGNRQWSDKVFVEDLMKKMRLKSDEMYDKSLISPTTAEKILKKNNPKKWSALQKLITQKQGQPSVVPESDKRPALNVKPADDFENLDTEDFSDVA